MRRILFLLQYRGGSTLFQQLQSTKKYDNPEVRKRLVSLGFSNTLGFLPSPIDEGVAVEINGAVDSFGLTEQHNLDNISHRRWHGDWWGQGKNFHTIPNPYDINSPSSFSPSAVSEYVEKGWKIVALVRDPRNLVCSTYSFHGGLETHLRSKDGMGYFYYLCKAVRNKYRMVIDSSAAFPDDFLVCRFEDLLTNPLSEMKKVYTFINVPLDTEVIKDNHLSIQNNLKAKATREKQVLHSSFSDSNFNNRWKDFPEEWTSVGFEFLSPEALELGY